MSPWFKNLSSFLVKPFFPLCRKTDTTETIIREVAPGVHTFCGPFLRSGTVEIGFRMTAIRMKDGNVLIYSSCKLDDRVEAYLDEVVMKNGGTVKYVVAPDVEHHMNMGDYQDKYPNATLIGVKGLREKRPDLHFKHVIGESEGDEAGPFGFESEFALKSFPGHTNYEVVLWHKPTGYMLEGDLQFNMPPDEQYPEMRGKWGWFQRQAHAALTPFTSSCRSFAKSGLTKDAGMMRRDVDYVLENWGFDKIIPSHGNIVEGNAKEMLRDTYSLVK